MTKLEQARLAHMRAPTTTVEQARTHVRRLERLGADVVLIAQAEKIVAELVAIEIAKIDKANEEKARN